jgi:hypothetical protein
VTEIVDCSRLGKEPLVRRTQDRYSSPIGIMYRTSDTQCEKPGFKLNQFGPFDFFKECKNEKEATTKMNFYKYSQNLREAELKKFSDAD